MSEDELRQEIIGYVRKKGTVQVFEVRGALKIDEDSVWLTIWNDLLTAGDIELVPGYHPNYYLAKYRVCTQRRLL